MNAQHSKGISIIHSMEWWWRHLRIYRNAIALSLVASLVGGIVASLDPLLIRHLIDVSLPHQELVNALLFVCLLALCFMGRVWFAGLSSFLTFGVTQGFGQDLRCDLLIHMSQLSTDWHEDVLLGEKLSRFDQDVEQIAQFSADTLSTVVRIFAAFAINLTIMFSLNWRMTIAALFLLPPFLWLRIYYKGKLEMVARDAQVATGAASALLAEHLAAVPQIQLLTSEAMQENRVRGTWVRMCGARKLQRKTEMLFSVAVTSVLAIAILLVLGSGIWEYRVGLLSLGGLVAFYAYVTRVSSPCRALWKCRRASSE